MNVYMKHVFVFNQIYSEDMRSTFPEDLADMSRYLAQILGFSQFEAEAAIANYYHMDSTLSGHVDKSEVNQEAPLFSLRRVFT